MSINISRIFAGSNGYCIFISIITRKGSCIFLRRLAGNWDKKANLNLKMEKIQFLYSCLIPYFSREIFDGSFIYDGAGKFNSIRPLFVVVFFPISMMLGMRSRCATNNKPQIFVFFRDFKSKASFVGRVHCTIYPAPIFFNSQETISPTCFFGIDGPEPLAASHPFKIESDCGFSFGGCKPDSIVTIILRTTANVDLVPALSHLV